VGKSGSRRLRKRATTAASPSVISHAGSQNSPPARWRSGRALGSATAFQLITAVPPCRRLRSGEQCATTRYQPTGSGFNIRARLAGRSADRLAMQGNHPASGHCDRCDQLL